MIVTHLCFEASLCFLTPTVATNSLDSQLFLSNLSVLQVTESRNLQNRARSKTEHEDEVTSQQDIGRGMVLQAALLVLLIEALAPVPLCL